MRGLGVLGGGRENYLERNEGKTKLNIRISMMAVDGLVRDTDGLHSPEQKQTGSNRARAPSPLHSSLSGKLEKKKTTTKNKPKTKNQTRNAFRSKSFPLSAGK